MSEGADFFQDPLRAIYYFDYDSLKMLLEALPDPVVARMASQADMRVRSKIFGAVDSSRSGSIKSLLGREESADPEKDQIVKTAVIRAGKTLMDAGRIKKDGIFYFAG